MTLNILSLLALFSVIHSNLLLIGLETVVMLPQYMNDKLLGGLVHRLGQASQLPNFNDSLHLLYGYNECLTLALEIVDVVLRNYHAALLMPIILVYLHDLAGHHDDLGSS
jgi:hypothetical protein